MSKPENNPKTLPLNECLAKTYQSLTGKKLAGRQVLNHIPIVGVVAKELLKRMPAWLVAELFPKESKLIVAAHDIAKVSPSFQEKLYRGTDGYKGNSQAGLKKINTDIEQQWAGHAGVSQIIAQYLKLGQYLLEILGQHHGYLPTISLYDATDQVFGGLVWQQRREQLLIELKKAILDNERSHQQPLLLHGNAWLKAELGKQANPGDSWFQASKRGILAPFAVGSIDQALMAASL